MRHAESAAPQIFHGAESDIGLSPHGHQQAQVVAQLYAELKPDAIISSNMLRARTTAQPIADACGLTLEIEPELHERRVGTLSGTPNADMNQGIWPDTLRHWLAGETSYAPPGSESFDDIQSRVLPAWERITHRYAGKSVVVIAHGIVCRVLLLSLLDGWSVADWLKIGRIPNVSISELIGHGTSWKAAKVGEIPSAVAALPHPHWS